MSPRTKKAATVYTPGMMILDGMAYMKLTGVDHRYAEESNAYGKSPNYDQHLMLLTNVDLQRWEDLTKQEHLLKRLAYHHLKPIEIDWSKLSDAKKLNDVHVYPFKKDDLAKLQRWTKARLVIDDIDWVDLTKQLSEMLHIPFDKFSEQKPEAGRDF